MENRWRDIVPAALVKPLRCCFMGKKAKFSVSALSFFNVVFPTYCKIQVDTDGDALSFQFRSNKEPGLNLIDREGAVYVGRALSNLGRDGVHGTYDITVDGDRAVVKF